MHNCLATGSSHATSRAPPITQARKRVPDISVFHKMFISVLCTARNPSDIMTLEKTDSRKLQGTYFGLDVRRGGHFVYLVDQQRLTTFKFDDCHFEPDVYPPLPRFITGVQLVGDVTFRLPTEDEQESVSKQDNLDKDVGRRIGYMPMQTAPDITPVVTASPHWLPPGYNYVGDRQNFGIGHCGDPNCTLPSGHSGLHSYLRSDVQGPPSNRTRSSVDLRIRGESADASQCMVGDLEPVSTENIYVFETGVWMFIDDVNGNPVCLNLAAMHDLPPPPANFREAKRDPFFDGPGGWLEAIQTDVSAKRAVNTFTEVPRPTDKPVCKSKTVLSYKWDKAHTVCSRHCRWVCCGFSQVWGENYFETYTGTPRGCSIRLFWAFVALHDLEDEHVDVRKAFTRNKIDCEMYVELPEGVYPEEVRRRTVGLLNMALEGSKQGGNIFRKGNKAALLKCGARMLDAEPTWFIIDMAAGLYILLLVWIDDIIAAFPPKARPRFLQFCTEYNAIYPIDTLGETKVFAGIQVIRDRRARTVKLHQALYVDKMADKFLNTTISKTVDVPVDFSKSKDNFESIDFAQDDAERQEMAGKPYLPLYASLLFKMCMTGPDLCYPLASLGRFIGDPSRKAWNALLFVLAYTVKNREIGVTYGGDIRVPEFFRDSAQYRTDPQSYASRFQLQHGLFAIPDASWKVLRSFGGFVVMFANGAVDWSTKLIRVICHSSMEAEICAGCFAGKRMMLVRSIMTELGDRFIIKGPIIICIDNEATLPVSKDEGVKRKTEHFLRWQHYLRYLVMHGFAIVFWVSTKKQPVDFMTKIIDKTSTLKGRAFVMNIPHPAILSIRF